MSAERRTAGPAPAGEAAGAPATDVGRLRETVGLLVFADRGVVRLSGPDAASFLQGLVTSDVRALDPGRGRDAAFLSPTGKLLARAAVFRTGPESLTLLLQAQAGPLLELLDRYHFGEDVEIADLSSVTTWISLQGPAAPAVATDALRVTAAPEPWELRSEAFAGGTLRLARMDEAGIPGLHLLADRGRDADELRRRLAAAVASRAGGEVTRGAWEVCRVLAGTPWMGADLDESVLPMEAGLDALLDHAKGCYVGQEVVARAQVRGRTNWSLWGVRLPAGVPLTAGRELLGVRRSRPAVRLRSVVQTPDQGRVGLAYVHRESAAEGPLRVVDPEAGELELVLEPLPFEVVRGT